MNLGQLTDFTRTFMQADGTTPLPAQHIRDLLNQAQDEMSAELRVPSKVLDVTDESRSFNLPADARDTNPLLYVRWVDGDRVKDLQIVSIAYANLKWPDWQEDSDSTDDPDVAIFTEGVDSMPDVYIYPNPGTESYHLHYVLKPSDMSAMSDEPFNGELDRFHIALAHKATFDVTGNDQRMAMYLNLLNKAAGNRRRGPKFHRSLLYRMGSRWL